MEQVEQSTRPAAHQRRRALCPCTSQWELHPCTSQWVLHPCTSQWVLHPCISQWVLYPCTSELVLHVCTSQRALCPGRVHTGCVAWHPLRLKTAAHPVWTKLRRTDCRVGTTRDAPGVKQMHISPISASQLRCFSIVFECHNSDKCEMYLSVHLSTNVESCNPHICVWLGWFWIRNALPVRGQGRCVHSVTCAPIDSRCDA